MNPALVELILTFGGALVVVLAMRWAIRKVAFRYMTFDVPLDGRIYKFNRETFTDAHGRPVEDPETLVRLEDAWREIELATARDAAAIQSTRL